MQSKIVYDVFNLVYWDWKVAMDLFLGGLGVGAFLFAIIVMFLKKDSEFLTVKIGSILGPLAMSVGLIFLLLEMGQPFRMYKTFTRFNITSPMSWGGILQEGFILFSTIFAILLFRKKTKRLRREVGLFAGLFALLVAVYHGFLLSFVTARPLWNEGAVSVATFIGSINAGVAAVLILTSFSKRGRDEIRELSGALKPFLLVTVLIQLSTLLLWIITLLTGKADFVRAFHMMNKNFGVLFWIGAITVGLILPFIIILAYSTGQRRDKVIPVFWVCIPILAGAYIFRYVLMLAGQIS